MVMMLNGSVSALASEVAVANETTALTEATEVAHVHGEECYTRTKVNEEPKCGKEVVEGHTHVDTCYEVTNTQECICTLEETAGHSHDDSCFETAEIQICTLEEHGHGDGCYTTEKELSCGQEESEEHVHGGECYTETKELNCGTEEHVHGGECYTTETVNTCGQEEKEAHSHGEGCYTTVENKTLICQLEEIESHTHGDDCYEWLEEQVCEIEVEEPAEDKTVAEDQLCVCRNPECPCTTCETECTCEEAEETDEEEVTVCETCQKEECECEKEVENNLIQTLGETTVELTGAEEAFEAEKTYALQVNELEEETAAMAAAAIKDAARTANLEVLDYQAFDITLTADEEDAQPKTEVEVKFTGAKIEEYIATEDAEVKAFYVDAEGNVEEIALTEGENEVVITTDHFSTYVVASVKNAEPVVLTTEADGTTITLSGPVSAFAEGKTYEITAAKVEAEEELEVIEEALEEVAEEQEKVVESYQAFDIKIIEKDETGAVTDENFQPLNETPVQVMFSGNEVAEAVFRINEEKNAEDMKAYVVEEAIYIETTHFSIYVLTEYKEECIESDSEVYEALLKRVEKIEAYEELNDTTYLEAMEVVEDIATAQLEKKLTVEDAEMLTERMTVMKDAYGLTVAEPGSVLTIEGLSKRGFFAFDDIEDGEEVPMLLRNSGMLYRLRGASGSSSLLPEDLGTSNEPSDSQIDKWGEENANSADKVRISKTIDGTDVENVFDITLAVETKRETVVESAMEVVIVMDVSNTMTYNFGQIEAGVGEGPSRYEAAMEAITGTNGFVNKFYEAINAGEISSESKISLVAFNTNATVIQEMSKCNTTKLRNNIKNTIKNGTSAIVTDPNYGGSVNRYTNIEAGLALGNEQFTDDIKPENRFIILLSDGFPTTYRKNSESDTNFDGWNPYMNSTHNPNYGSVNKTPGKDGYFYDQVRGKLCTYGTSYSDKAAKRARAEANAIKKDGVNIFSVGVDIGGQTIKRYIDQFAGKDFSVVDCTGNTYEIGSASSPDAFKNWLKNSIGSGIYYDSNKGADLTAAFDDMFLGILRKYSDGVTARQVVDVIPDNIEFIGIVDYHNVPEARAKVVKNSDGTTTLNWGTLGNDDATSKTTKKNVALTRGIGTEDTFIHKITYRVRLMNEAPDFVEGTSYNTNQSAVFKYKNYTNVYNSAGNKISAASTQTGVKTMEYTSPSVHGYLVNLAFDKVDQYDRPVEGAEFTLTHDTTCNVCRGDGKSAVNVPEYTAESDANGKVNFTGIPSGHKYIMKETKTPEDYQIVDLEYRGVAAYDVLTVTPPEDVKDDWAEGKVENILFYELPSTGGIGTGIFKMSGLALMSGAVLFLNKKKKDEEEV